MIREPLLQLIKNVLPFLSKSYEHIILLSGF